MKPELQKQLRGDFTCLRQIADERYAYPMFGIEVGAGWYTLLRDLFTKIDKHLEETDNKDFCFTQIKEKFGLLRIYCQGADDYIYNLIDKYEQKSSKICEDCGKRGRLRYPMGWFFVACRKHYQDYCIDHIGRKLTWWEELKKKEWF